MMKQKIAYCLVGLFFCMTLFGQTNNGVIAKIEKKDIEGIFVVNAVANNNSKIFQSLSYQMLAVKQGNTGNMSSSQQSGKFTLKPNESKKLSEMTINYEKEDGLKIFLFVRDEKNNTVAKDSLIYNASKKMALSEKKNLKKKTSTYSD